MTTRTLVSFWTSVSNAVSSSRSFFATTVCSRHPSAEAATSASLRSFTAAESSLFVRSPMLSTFGTNSRRNCSLFAARAAAMLVTPCDVTARPIQAGNDSICDWVGPGCEYNRNRGTYTCGLHHLCGTNSCRSPGDNDVDPQIDQFFHQA